jgi:hypothetical protein
LNQIQPVFAEINFCFEQSWFSITSCIGKISCLTGIQWHTVNVSIFIEKMSAELSTFLVLRYILWQPKWNVETHNNYEFYFILMIFFCQKVVKLIFLLQYFISFPDMLFQQRKAARFEQFSHKNIFLKVEFSESYVEESCYATSFLITLSYIFRFCESNFPQSQLLFSKTWNLKNSKKQHNYHFCFIFYLQDTYVPHTTYEFIKTIENNLFYCSIILSSNFLRFFKNPNTIWLHICVIRAYFWKKIALLNSLTLSVCPSVRLSVCPSVRLSVCPSVRLSVCPSVRPSVCTLFFRHRSTYDLQILDSKRRLSIYEEYGWVFRSRAQELWDWAQIRTLSNHVFSLYFINFWEKINVFQLLSQGYSKIQIFQKKNSLEALEAAGSGSKLGFSYSHLEKQDKESFTEVVT